MNRLAFEKSPYLLQHANNPVDWFPWSPEAFHKAAEEDKFVFLSVGYSTCHWCHVMERESFEHSKVAELLSQVAVAIKVDREERPDVDQVYMAACHAVGGRGGWPLTAFLTPEGVPFYAGTYFPRESRHGRPGLVDVLHRIAELWRNDRAALLEQGRRILAHIEAQRPEGSGSIELAALGAAEAHFRHTFDAARGGFGSAPKFPTPHQLTFLLRRFRRTRAPDLLVMVEKTLDEMARGGLFDHLGGGFHRYAADSAWLLPHFEKMLYDQAGLATAYLETHQASGAPRWAGVAEQIFEYVLRDLLAPGGAFCSAEDADSEGVEGKFYVWTRDEILRALGREDGDLFCRVYGVTEEGNFREEATGQRTGANVLHLPRPLLAWSAELGVEEPTLADRLSASRRRLLERRGARVRPLLDDKILTAWNGLMISALARGAAVLGRPLFAAAARRAADFVLSTMRPGGRLHRRYRDGETAVPGFAEDYAFLARGLLDLYAATFESARLGQALQLGTELVERFWDDARGGLFDAAGEESLVLRPKEAYDGATPSANSAALEVFARLWKLTGNPSWETRARALCEAFGAEVRRVPAAFTQLLQGAELLLEPGREVVIVGRRGDSATEALWEAVRRTWCPEAAVLFAGAGEEEIRGWTPYAAVEELGAEAAAHVCEGFACRTPLTDPEALRSCLASAPTL